MPRLVPLLFVLALGGGVAGGCIGEARSKNGSGPPGIGGATGLVEESAGRLGTGRARTPPGTSPGAWEAVRPHEPGTPITGLVALAEAVEGCGVRPAGDPGQDRCIHLAYIWSPSMPLSELGIDEARRAADATGAALAVIPAPDVLEPADHPAAEGLRAALVAAGATVHYPSLAVLVGGGVRRSALVGYKRADAYRKLIRERLSDQAGPAGPDTRPPAPTDPATADGEGPPDPRRPPDVEVLWTHTVEPPPGAFFRRVPGTTFITFDQRGAVHVRDLASAEQFRGPGWIDFVPTPDGRLFVTPGRANSGLEFYLAQAVFERGAEGTAADLDPLVRDRRMADQYPSAGILEVGPGGEWTRYRILVSWFAGLAFRDYAVRWAEEGPPEIEAVSEKLTACPGHDLSTPILSKDGREVAARDEGTGTTKVFRLEGDGSCREILDLGRQTSKVGFSDDGTLIAYSSPDPASSGRGVRSTTWVLDRVDMRTTAVPHSRSAGLVIPEVVGADSLLIAVKEEPRSRSAEFRLLCCVR